MQRREKTEVGRGVSGGERCKSLLEAWKARIWKKEKSGGEKGVQEGGTSRNARQATRSRKVLKKRRGNGAGTEK